MNSHAAKEFRDFHINRISIDSRAVQPGDLFLALKGERCDGHDFVIEAERRGAAAAMVSSCWNGSCGIPLIKVDCPQRALQQIAADVLRSMRCKVVAVTGSVGKTTTKEFIATLLSGAFRIAATPGNANSQIGLPLSILNDFQGDEEIVVLEMGMSGARQIAKLIDIAPPDISVITAVELVHAQFFNNLESIGRAKGEILRHPRTHWGVLSKEIVNLAELLNWGTCQKTVFSTKGDADYCLLPCAEYLQVVAEGETHRLPLPPVPGRHNLHNLLAAITVARKLGVSWEIIADRIPHLQLPEKRLQPQIVREVTFINDAYNACEASVKAALDALPNVKGQKIAVLGSMLELGCFSNECHEAVGKYALPRVDKLFCLGKECAPMVECWQKAGRPAALFEDRSALAEELKKQIGPQDVVLLKGSRAKEMWKIIDEVAK